jgi:hypothetical protein
MSQAGVGLDDTNIANLSFSTSAGSSFRIESDVGESSQETVGKVSSTELSVMLSHSHNSYANVLIVYT